jgi:fumarate hydratase class II
MSDGRFREERDSMGTMKVPEDALWGATTQRAVENFPVSGRSIPRELISAFGHLKAACAKVNRDLGKLPEDKAAAIIAASEEIARGEHDRHFPIDVFQTGSGTSSNMNANEVIANIASRRAGRPIGSFEPIHPNDHANMGQSSNDTFPTAMHVAAAVAIFRDLVPALEKLEKALGRRAKEWDSVVKIGRTHLMDATPIRMGQVFSGFASQAEHAVERARRAVAVLGELAIGGTAVGTGINTDVEFGARVSAELSQRLGVPFREAANHFEAQAAKDAYVEASGEMKVIAVGLSKIASDIRLLGSGPRCGIFELMLPAVQPGSSIMPGKVNPVICESMIQVAAQVVGNDAALTYGGFGGVGSLLELNVAMPLMAERMMDSIHLLARASHMFVDKLLDGLEVNKERCEALIDQSLMMVTSLAPEIGYENAAKLAKEAFASGKTIRELALEKKLMSAERLKELLDPMSMTRPGGKGPGGG